MHAAAVRMSWQGSKHGIPNSTSAYTVSKLHGGGVSLTRDYAFSKRSAHPRIRSDTAVFLLCVTVFLLAAALGYGVSALSFSEGDVFLLSPTDSYAGCHLPIEYVQRASLLCRPIFLESFLLLFFAYVKFGKALTSFFFLYRGIVFGVSVNVCLQTEAAGKTFILPIIYAVVTTIYLIFARALRHENGICAASETCVCALIACGAAASVQLLISFFF